MAQLAAPRAAASPVASAGVQHAGESRAARRIARAIGAGGSGRGAGSEAARSASASGWTHRKLALALALARAIAAVVLILDFARSIRSLCPRSLDARLRTPSALCASARLPEPLLEATGTISSESQDSDASTGMSLPGTWGAGASFSV